MKKNIRAQEKVEYKSNEEVQVLSDNDYTITDENVRDIHATVTFALSRNFNIGDFNSVKAHVSVSAPCNTEDIDKAYEACQAFCVNKIGKIAKMIEKKYGKK